MVGGIDVAHVSAVPLLFATNHPPAISISLVKSNLFRTKITFWINTFFSNKDTKQ
jgi:hypothetical protein